MSVNIIDFENTVIAKMLQLSDDSYTETLRKQFQNSAVTKREFTGHGFFTYYDVTNHALCLDKSINIELGGPHIVLDGLKHGAGSVLFVRDGMISVLEFYCYDEAWPKTINNFQLYDILQNGALGDLLYDSAAQT